MNQQEQNIAIAEACGWRRWQFGDPYLEGLKLADTKFDGYVRTVERVVQGGVTLDIDESPLFTYDVLRSRFLPVNYWRSPIGFWTKNHDNYCRNLIACHEMEETLTKEERRRWEFVIADMFREQGQTWFDVCHMSAAKRAEAFLRVKGLWKD